MGLWIATDLAPDRHPPDVALMLRVRDGDQNAFSQLYLQYHRRLQNFFHGLSRDAQVSSDLCQETFLRIWKLRRKYAALGSFKAYLFTFARNIWLEHCRQLTKDKKLGFRNAWEEDFEGVRACESRDPDTLASRSETMERIGAALDELPEEQRMVFVLRMVEGLSLEEIADIMQCPVNTVRSRKLLAVKKLRGVLSRVFSI